MGQQHKGTNPDFPDNFCGFTLMTASAAHRPFETPGRESASQPLQANIFKRQYLNYRHDFKIDVPVKAINPSDLESPGIWIQTAPSPELGKIGQTTLYPSPQNAAYPIAAPHPPGPIVSRTAQSAKRYHERQTFMLTKGGFKPGVQQTGFNSGRLFVRRAVASEPIPPSSRPSGPLAFGAQPFFRTDKSTDLVTIPFNDYEKLGTLSVLSGSAAKKPTESALYILKPGDKIAVGVQPSLPGWNAGSGLPNNRWSTKAGVYDDAASYRAGYVKTHDIDDPLGKKTVATQPKMNL